MERAHLPASRRPPRRRPAQGASLLRPSLGGRLQRGRPPALLALLPPTRRRGQRGMDPRIPHRLLDARAHRARSARHEGAHPPARPARALPLGPDPPARDEHAHASSTATSRARSHGASTRRSCAACWQPSRSSGSTSASTRPAAPTRPGSWPGPTRSSTSRRSTPARTRCAAKRNPTTSRKFEPSGALRTALLDGWAPDLAQLPDLVPGLDLSLWPSAREVGLA